MDPHAQCRLRQFSFDYPFSNDLCWIALKLWIQDMDEKTSLKGDKYQVIALCALKCLEYKTEINSGEKLSSLFEELEKVKHGIIARNPSFSSHIVFIVSLDLDFYWIFLQNSVKFINRQKEIK